MNLVLLAKDGGSGLNGCPSVYLADDGSLIVQDDLLDAATAANLQNVLPGEGAVRIKTDVVAEAPRLDGR